MPIVMFEQIDEHAVNHGHKQNEINEVNHQIAMSGIRNAKAKARARLHDQIIDHQNGQSPKANQRAFDVLWHQLDIAGNRPKGNACQHHHAKWQGFRPFHMQHNFKDQEGQQCNNRIGGVVENAVDAGFHLLFAQFIRRCARGFVRLQIGRCNLIENIQTNQSQTRQQGAREQIVHRNRVRGKVALCDLGILISNRKLITKQNQHDGRRNDLAKRARSRNGTAGKGGIIATAQHHWQGHQAHGHNRRAHNACGSCKQSAHNTHGIAKTAWQSAKQFAHIVQKFFGNTRTL